MSDELKAAFEKWWMGEPVLDHITASNVENAKACYILYGINCCEVSWGKCDMTEITV